MKMEKDEVTRYGLPILLVVVVVVAVIIFGLASQNPDGFEWTLFDFAGVDEPEGGFEGIWSFLGEGTAVEVATGLIGIVAILLLSYGFFWSISRRTK